jgi:multiple sugar transport system substrate-binding protein
MCIKNGGLFCLWTGIVVLILAGCDRTSEAGRNSGPLVIKVATWEGDISYNINIREAFLKAHPDIKLELIDIPSADYTQKLSVMLNGGSDVDSFWIKDGDTTKGLVNRGQLADLSAYVQRDNIRLEDYNGLAERFNIGGKLVALPASTGYYILYYNKDIFDKAGVPYPSNDMTWGEWETLSRRLSSGRGNSKVWGALLHTWPACVQNWGVQDGKNTIMATDYSFFKPYYEMVLRMQEAATLWDYGSLRTGGIHYSSAFLQGNVATLPMGTWYFYTILDRIKAGETNINFGIATLPHPKGIPAGWTVGSVTPIAINQASKNKDAAWEFVKFVTSDEGAGLYAEGGGIPSKANTKTLEAIARIPGMPEGSLAALEVKNIALDRPMEDFVAEVNQMLGEEHSLIMLKEVSIDEGLAKMAKRSKEIQGK